MSSFILQEFDFREKSYIWKNIQNQNKKSLVGCAPALINEHLDKLIQHFTHEVLSPEELVQYVRMNVPAKETIQTSPIPVALPSPKSEQAKTNLMKVPRITEEEYNYLKSLMV